MKSKFIIIIFLLISFNLFAFEKLLQTGVNDSFNINLKASNVSYRIDYTKWEPESSTDNGHTIIYNHGLQSHRGWYNSTAEQLREAGLSLLLLIELVQEHRNPN